MKMARREALPACGPVWKTGPPRRWLPLSKSALRTEVPLTGSADSLPSGKSDGKKRALAFCYVVLKLGTDFMIPPRLSLIW